MGELVTLTREDEIAVITVDNPPVNALSPGVPEGIIACVRAAQKDEAVRALVLVGGGKTFIAGADIKEFVKMTTGKSDRKVGLYPLMFLLEESPKPIVSAIHGAALGGGLEVALSCHYRISAPSAQVGQPEVKLGLIPGAGGTQRLPRLAGIAKAVEMCTQGNAIKAADAVKFGIVDRLIEGDLVQGAVKFAREVLASGQPPRRTRDQAEKLGNPVANASLFAAAREEVRRRDRGRIAPLKAIDAIQAAAELPFERGIAREAELFEDCLFSEESKALVHVFFAEREVTKIPGVTRETPVLEIRKAAVVGGGTMGSGIAMTYANAGIPVLLREVSQEALERSLAGIRRNYASSVQRGRFTQEYADQRLQLIQGALSNDGFADVDIVVEAVFEGPDLKRQVFAELDKICKAETILASNTSTLDIDQIAQATSRPQRVIGNHFFAPPNVMRLLEIVRGKASAPDVIASCMALAKKLGKVGVLVGNRHGFVGNRMYLPYQREAQFLVEEGAKVEEVDAALYNFGMAMGPLATMDLSGLDVGWRIRQESKHVEIPGLRQPLVEDRLCEMGRFGQKTGAGWYRYQPGDRKPIPDPAVDEVIRGCARQAGIKTRPVSAAEIVDRTIYALINEGAKILGEGIALRASDIDIVYIYGYGFPSHRGGPMWYADTVGAASVYARVCELREQHGDHWKPAPLLEQLAKSGKSFADFDSRSL
jgi:3-hydroxyacyl-CoA dehydrogenase